MPSAPASTSAAESAASPAWWDEARSALQGCDPRLNTLLTQQAALGRLQSRGDPFVTLVRSIVGQQISVKAAESVWQRFAKAARTVTPDRVSRMRASTLTGAGLSGRKAEYVRDLALHFREATVNPEHWPGLDDESVIAELVQVRGIGRWTAEMFLIFNLMRPDVFPVDDLGLLKALSIHFNDGQPIDRAQALTLGEPWRPWRTLATWSLWRSLDPVPVAY